MILGNSLTRYTNQNTSLNDTTGHSTISKNQPIPRRIVCITPLGTELLYALGCGEMIVGVDTYSDYPPEVDQKKNVGSFFDTNFEAITALKPDLLVILGQSQKITEFCIHNKIRLLRLTMSDMASIYEDILLTGNITGRIQTAQELCNNIFRDLNEISAKAIASNGDTIERKKVFLCINRKPGTLSNLGTIGPETSLNELIHIAGGTNIFCDLVVPYADISRESLISRRPDIIIEAASREVIEKSSEQLIQQWKKLPVPASENNRIYFIDENILNRPGVRSPIIAGLLYQLINKDLN